MGAYSVVQCTRHLMGQPLYCSAVDTGMWEDRGYGEGPAPMNESSTALLPWLPSFPPQAFCTTISSLTSLDLSLHSQQQPFPWDCSTIPKFQLLATTPSRGPVSLSGVCMATERTVWFSFHLGCHRSAVSLPALNVSPLTQTIALMWGMDPCFSSHTHWGQVQCC